MGLPFFKKKKNSETKKPYWREIKNHPYYIPDYGRDKAPVQKIPALVGPHYPFRNMRPDLHWYYSQSYGRDPFETFAHHDRNHESKLVDDDG